VLSLRFIAFLFALAVAADFAQADDLPPPGFIPLFNGRDLKGWRGGDTYDHGDLLRMNKVLRERQIEKWGVELTVHWRVEDSELVSNGVGRFLTTERDFGDFELLAEYRIEASGDSGIYLRGVPQVQLWDPANPQLAAQGAGRGSGGLWNNRPGTPGRDPLVRADHPAGEWNAVRVQMVGSRVSVWLNGQLVVDHAVLANFFHPSKPIIARGPIQLQTHGGEMRWRHLFLREIPGEEANRLLAERGRGGGFQPLWNGRDFTGWAGETGAFQFIQGAIHGKPDGRGTMFFAQTLSDFVVRLEFLTLPGGIGGLALRYPGTGDPATAGWCRIQMLDEHYEHRRGPIEQRQAHGSAYGIAAALRGYQRAQGDWNFQEVTVRGSTVRVELNGCVILESDLSVVVPAPYLRSGDAPWAVRRSGFFGLVAEGAGIGVRRLEYRALPTFAK